MAFRWTWPVWAQLALFPFTRMIWGIIEFPLLCPPKADDFPPPTD